MIGFSPIAPRLQAALLQRYEPILRFTRGENFFPVDVDRYLQAASLWIQRPQQDAECLVPPGQLTPERLVEAELRNPESVQFLRFTDPLRPREMAEHYAHHRLESRHADADFRPGTGRLARVGYTARMLDAIFNVTLLARGRVPGDTAAASAIAYNRMIQQREGYSYYGRVFQEGGWTVLQYWFFYVFNNWRSGFSGANDHEADWEMISIYLSTEDAEAEPPIDPKQAALDAWMYQYQPTWVAYAAHDDNGDNLRRSWHDPELERVGLHPVVYVGAGSHAGYFSRGDYLTEIELSFLSPLVRVTDALSTFWHESLRQYRSTDDTDIPHPNNIFLVPFIDYARGDGLAIGPGQPQEWETPMVLTEADGWLTGYRGLWGFFARDPFAGENAPAGPMYNRDRTVRRAWYDPVGWAGLDKAPPPGHRLSLLEKRRAETQTQLRALEQKINDSKQAARRLKVAAEAIDSEPHLKQMQIEYRRQMVKAEEELAALQREAMELREVLVALGRQALRVREGFQGNIRGHLERPREPMPEAAFRAGRLAEVWAAASIGLMMVAFVALTYFARQYLIFGLASLLGLYVFIEATFRGRVTRLVTSVTLALTVVAALVLFYEFFWSILSGLTLAAGAYLLWQNLRELQE
ncbi:MAG: hypothetical protein WDZ49_05575 [Litorilinea sp.]